MHEAIHVGVLAQHVLDLLPRKLHIERVKEFLQLSWVIVTFGMPNW